MFQLCEMNTRETVPKHSLFRFGVQLKRAFVGDNATRCHQSNNRKVAANSEQAKRRARWNNCPMFYCSNGSHKIVLACGVLKVPIRKDIIHRVVRWQLDKGQQVLYISLIYNLILEYQ
ncbi:hypothetical protein HanIR_Chr06g0273251 [Helianthus annuus]|nr:uncharacterized protein LOC110865164 [Helianthus annuus]KAJ0566390.1 hypothetical protein HanIR_Chr06g0273251 [Helianthus annuus]